MKYRDVEIQLKEYYTDKKDDNKELDTIRLLNRLRPVINNKCEFIRSRKEKNFEGVIFTICEIAAIFVGLIILFPELIDFTDEFIEFSGLALFGITTLVGIYFTITALIVPRQVSNLRKS